LGELQRTIYFYIINNICSEAQFDILLKEDKWIENVQRLESE